ncbi:hypothetical protein MAPG_00485 [Magnaporthiopsis poae ATCC 64411]|uniref:Uncharacterized protein n=1 Tax=Magnaporthiopsis poae (strain ATCC 64411 / 73-15) TaxID=644358 RepID=A0A0C4DL47_MAGP6|nr:hypothetical protein MAPG_00485 [Magnaporthiopsis poae ATCC 64411]
MLCPRFLGRQSLSALFSPGFIIIGASLSHRLRPPSSLRAFLHPDSILTVKLRANNVFVAFATIAAGAVAAVRLGQPGKAIAGRDSLGVSVRNPNQLPAKRQAGADDDAKVSPWATALVAIASAIPRDLGTGKVGSNSR